MMAVPFREGGPWGAGEDARVGGGIEGRHRRGDHVAEFGGLEHDEQHLTSECVGSHCAMLEPALRPNLQFKYYPAGHMVYLNPEALHQMRLDMERYYAEGAR